MLEATAAKPRILKKLAALKPGKAQSLLTTQTQSQPEVQAHGHTETRLANIETILVSMAQGQHASRKSGDRKTIGQCKEFLRTGSCSWGANCKFLHSTSPATLPVPPPGQWCTYHKTPWHNTSDCRKAKQQLAGQTHATKCQYNING